MLHHSRQFDRERTCQIAYRNAALSLETRQDGAAGGINQGRKSAIKQRVIKVHHMVKYLGW